MSTYNFAGLLIYRISPRKPIEYLLLNDSFEHHRHWYPPKGRRVGAEDELKCAVRETLDLTGLGPNELVTDEAFRAELKYVDGIKLKQVVYFLARLSAPYQQGMIRCENSGVKYQWYTLDQALGKVVFPSMQNILTQAEDYIEEDREDMLVDKSSRWQTVGADQGRGNRGSGNRRYENDENDHAYDDNSAWRTQRGASANNLEGRFRKLNVGADSQQRNSSRAPADRDQQQQQQQGQQARPQDNPRYKTKLCDKFERDGECPYHHKCVFAHGESELRVRETTPTTPSFRNGAEERTRDHSASSNSYSQQQQQQSSSQNQTQSQSQSPHYNQQTFRGHQASQSHQGQQQQQQPRTPVGNNTLRYNSNPLYKTRPCQRFSEQGECPYGEKCQFAHGEEELRAAPEQPTSAKTPREGQFQNRANTNNNEQGPNNGFNRNAAGQSQTWRKGAFDGSSERGQIPNFTRNASWSNTPSRPIGNSPSISDDGSLDSSRYPAAAHSPSPAVSAGDGDFKTSLAAPLVTPVPQMIPSPTAATSSSSAKNAVSTGAAKKVHDQAKSGSYNKEVNGEKPWIKVVELNEQDLQQMGSPLADNSGHSDAAKPKQLSKTAELETRLTRELVESLAKASGGNQEPTVQAAFKEITHLEFRNNLGKQQLLNIVITALFAPCKAVGVSEVISRNTELLSKIMTKSQDQVFMLNSWQRLLADDENALAWQKKASEVLGSLYKSSLLDEDVFMAWFEKKSTDVADPAIAAMKPFAHWLATAEEE
ncbi:hypothetical protein GGI07_003955 [Coemansia sp. Benny D115]|nr:hypothetical protein GGI07_003955 [Coemansia sp. Benny D115]